MAERRAAEWSAPDGVELGIDSASTAASVAVMRGERVLAERRWALETTFSQELLAAIDAVLREAAVARGEIAAIAVDAGPGGYSGLRTGVATAQGLALALDVPLAGLSRLEADAFPHLDGERTVVAVHDLGRERAAWAAYAAGDDDEAPLTLVEPRIDGFEGCAREAPVGALWCGELSDELRAALDAAGRRGDDEALPQANHRSAADLMRLARLHDAYTDPARVDVVYLRPPPITAPRPASR